MKKGIVLELDEEFVTLLTPEGEFIQVKKEDEYEIGEEIEAKMVKKPYVRHRSFRYAAVSLIAAAVLLIATLFRFPSNEVYAYMSIDINPSIEVGVDEQLKVLKLKAYNEEGEKIASQLSRWKNEAFVVITKEIIELSMKKGYLQKGGQVLITTVERKHRAASSRKLSTELMKIQHSYQQKNIIVKTEESTMEVRNKAVEKGMTTGKLLQMEQKMKAVSPKPPKAKKLEKPLKQKDGNKKNEQQTNHSSNKKDVQDHKNIGREKNEQQANDHSLDEQNDKKNKDSGHEKNEQQAINHSLQKKDKDEQKWEENNSNEKKVTRNHHYPFEEKDEQKKSNDEEFEKNSKLPTKNSQYHHFHRSYDDHLKHYQKKNNSRNEHYGKRKDDKNFQKSSERDHYEKRNNKSM
ncbi:anti-sigma factor domain-containing protein [Parageobacillus sp. VR-IP]|uniref:anti-sigma factor domain-containing protein n=1 Tax=Parageobacillus sp. VR-IP TaxID=2742205 RepID=UPI001582E5E3|nr:anti-sigma factor domain-containing protein [Parageobacillus sp. VR-IP]NUK28852.1 anti-sigma factor domain-containing protein [Parageobacillus sp. VR-IP]